MFDAAQTSLVPAREVVRTTALATAANGLRYASFGSIEVSAEALRHVVEAVPPTLAAALVRRAYYFVPLAISETDETEIAPGFTLDLGDRATCHRNVTADGVECTFISARLMQDRFALAFEFFINIGHQLVDAVGVPKRFADLAWAQAKGDVRGETSQDAWEARRKASEMGLITHLAASSAEGSAEPGRSGLDGAEPGRAEVRAEDRARTEFFEAAFADTLAIYMLSLAMDLDYADLREREYPLLAAPALADRLRLAAELFPPAGGYEFSIRYRRRH
jgi:hypothetical protein